MAINYQDTWDEIQGTLIIAAGEPNERRQARDALEIKTAVESIEQQKDIANYTNCLVEHQKRTKRATWVLAILTGLLFLSTAFYTIFTYKAYQASGKQVVVINNLKESIQDVGTTLSGISQSIEKLPLIDKKIKRINPHSALKENELEQRMGGYGTGGRR